MLEYILFHLQICVKCWHLLTTLLLGALGGSHDLKLLHTYLQVDTVEILETLKHLCDLRQMLQK